VVLVSEVETRLAEEIARDLTKRFMADAREFAASDLPGSHHARWLFAFMEAELARVRTDTITEAEKAIRGVYGVAQDPDHALDLALAAVRGVSHEH
jgi:hypothetical protein